MTRFRARPRPLATRGIVRTSRVRRREAEFVAARGKCDKCRKTRGLEAFWLSKDDRPLVNMQAFWLASDAIRMQLADKVAVLCEEHMRLHRGGVEHGGGVTGVKGCDCEPCVIKRREYVKNKHREHRKAKREAT